MRSLLSCLAILALGAPAGAAADPSAERVAIRLARDKDERPAAFEVTGLDERSRRSGVTPKTR